MIQPNYKPIKGEAATGVEKKFSLIKTWNLKLYQNFYLAKFCDINKILL